MQLCLTVHCCAIARTHNSKIGPCSSKVESSNGSWTWFHLAESYTGAGSTASTSTSHWTEMDFQTKYYADGTLDKRKARLVAKGYSQVVGVDYEVWMHHTMPKCITWDQYARCKLAISGTIYHLWRISVYAVRKHVSFYRKHFYSRLSFHTWPNFSA